MQAALEAALSLGGVGDEEIEIVDTRAELETLVMLRQDLRRIEEIALQLTPDQRLVLACQAGLQIDRAAFCRQFDWSHEKYRKVAQRARARLRSLMSEAASVESGGGVSVPTASAPDDEHVVSRAGI